MFTSAKLPLATDAPSALTVNKLSSPAFVFSLILPSLPFSRPSPTWVSATSMVMVCLPLLDLEVTFAPPLPSNNTSSACLTCWLFSSVVPFLLDNTQPNLRKSPTVAAVLSATNGCLFAPFSFRFNKPV